MNRQGFRSICKRARPTVQSNGHSPRNHFGTNQWPATDSEATAGAPKPSPRERTRASVSKITALLKSEKPLLTNKKPSPLSQAQALGGRPKIIDVRSLPRGGLRGRGGFLGLNRGPLGRVNQFSRGQGAAAPGGSGGSVAGRRRKKGTNDEDADKEPRTGRKRDPYEVMDEEERKFDRDMRFGTKTQYNPSLTLESLAAFMPLNTSTPTGRSATVLQNLSVLGTADHVGVPLALQARSYAQDLEDGGMRFFADPRAVETAEEHLQKKRRAEAAAAAAAAAKKGEKVAPCSTERIVNAAAESVRTVIVDKAVVGQHEKPQFATDPVGMARSWHLRAETYTQKNVESFEKKLRSLVRSGNAGGVARADGRARAQ